MPKNISILMFFIGFFVLVSGCTGTPKKIDSKALEGYAADTQAILDQYIVGVGDLIRVDVWRNPELSIQVPVRPDGRISTPLVGDVMATGSTPGELADKIKEKLSYYIREPQVSVIVMGLASKEFQFRVRVTGAVRSPLSLPFRNGMTVLDLVLEAGGTTEFAAANKTVLHRKTEQGVRSLPIRLEDLLTEGELASNFALQPGDVITVPERLF